MTEIGREAGMAAGTIYNYFDGKEGLFRSLVELRGEEMTGRMAAIVDGPGDAIERLRAFLDAHLAYVEQHRAMYGIMVERAGNARDCPGAEQLCARYEAMIGRLLADGVAAGLLRRDVDLEDHAIALGGLMQGAARLWYEAGRGPLAARAPKLLDLFLNGLGAR
jgi:AcrR family transcriptional regulator